MSNDRPALSHGRGLRVAFVIVFVAIVCLVVAAGCGSSYSSMAVNQLTLGPTDTYILQVLDPPDEGRLQVEAHVPWVWAERQTEGEELFQMVEIKGAADGNVPMFLFETPAGSRPHFVVRVLFPSGECYRPSESLYCGPVVLLASSSHGQRKTPLATADVSMRSEMSNLQDPLGDIRPTQVCQNSLLPFPKEPVSDWRPRSCIYEQQGVLRER